MRTLKYLKARLPPHILTNMSLCAMGPGLNVRSGLGRSTKRLNFSPANTTPVQKTSSSKSGPGMGRSDYVNRYPLNVPVG